MQNPIQQTVFCLIVVDNQILLLERQNTWFENGKLCPPGGNVDPGESPITAAIRETFEETNLQVEDLKLIKEFTTQVGSKKFHNFYYLTRKCKGTIENKEADRHRSISWYNTTKLPANTSLFVTDTINCLKL